MALDPEKLKAKYRRRYHRDVEASREKQRQRRVRDVEKRRAEDRARYAREAEARKARAKAWGKANPAYLAHQVAMRRARLAQATPPWLTADHKRQIAALYREARERDGTWEVDHEIPLRGRNVCGLHVPWNLRVIARSDNRKKSNSYEA